MRWPHGFVCPRCGGRGSHRLRTRRLEQCRAYRYQVSPIAGTIFHRTRVPLRAWLLAIFFVGRRKQGISALCSVGEGRAARPRLPFMSPTLLLPYRCSQYPMRLRHTHGHESLCNWPVTLHPPFVGEGSGEGTVEAMTRSKEVER